MQVEIDEITRLNCLLNIYVDANVDKDFSVLSKNEDPFFIFNRTGQLVYVNDLCETLLKYSRSELLHMALGDIFSPSVLNESQTFFLQKDIEKLVNFDSQIKRKQQRSLVDVNVTTFPVFFEEEIVGSYVVLKDVTLIKKERERISHKQAVAGQLAAGVAHEIRNPITAIKGFLQLMMKEYKGEISYFNIIDSEINRIEAILTELMVLAKPTKVKYKRLNIRLLVQHVITLMESQALLNNVEVKTSYTIKDETVFGDENQLKQVFINYIKNAIEAMPEGGKLEVEGLKLNDDIVQFRIIDQGCGIPLKVIDKINEPFFTTKENGTGLGLAVSSQIIQDHKGEFNIKSTIEGTCIEVNLPIMR
ncbi:ATP-binding protein [Bacillus sp. Marseille-P3661]|uniref:ATP-binding protein n=1 Tax=Bacillus sp. Marseille-P3661 TaxID=1936234 RepID=UPI000C83E69E|nr:ATP-binding protein [Bacillus sp. Marseille-P3661]